jgi:hypothetical protein
VRTSAAIATARTRGAGSSIARPASSLASFLTAAAAARAFGSISRDRIGAIPYSGAVRLPIVP